MYRDLLDKLRMFLAWTVGITFVIAFNIGVTLLLEKINVQISPSKIFHDEFGSEVVQIQALAGTAVMFLSIMLGTRLGMAIFAGHWRGGNTEAQEVDFVASICGVVMVGFFAMLMEPFFDFHDGAIWNLVKYAAQIILALGVFLLCKRFRDDRLAYMVMREKALKEALN
jgi:hypothetical protein